jgi:hypothetical protein
MGGLPQSVIYVAVLDDGRGGRTAHALGAPSTGADVLNAAGRRDRRGRARRMSDGTDDDLDVAALLADIDRRIQRVKTTRTPGVRSAGAMQRSEAPARAD